MRSRPPGAMLINSGMLTARLAAVGRRYVSRAFGLLLRQACHLLDEPLRVFGLDAQLAKNVLNGLATRVENVHAFFICFCVQTFAGKLMKDTHWIWLASGSETGRE